MWVGIGVGIGRNRFATGIFNAYALRVTADGGITEAGQCVDAVTGLLLNASLLLIPSGYKGGKLYSEIPTNGNGDLTWTRGSDAFRTNASGLLQRVPWNLLTNSNELASQQLQALGKYTISSNVAISPDGTQNADKFVITGTDSYQGVVKTPIPNGTYTISMFAKASGKNWVFFYEIGSPSGANGVWFNISTGQIGSIGSAWSNVTITNVGNDWYRCSATTTLSATNYLYWLVADSNSNPNVTANGTDGVLMWGLQFVEGTTAQTYLPTTDRLNFPRLSYMYGSCPSVLLEPQRTNLVLQSETFDNASWTKVASSITANSTTAPDGNTTADTFSADGTTAAHFITQSMTVTSGVTYSLSYFVKKNTNDFVQLFFNNGFGVTAFANFNINTGVVGTVGSTATASITSLSNGWYRCSITSTATSTITNNAPSLAIVNSNTATIAQTNNLSTSVFIYGAQLEAGAYPTTYIPTTGSATATRVADSFSRNNIYTNGLISASGGTWFVELRNNVAYTRDSPGALYIGTNSSDANSGNGLLLRNPGGSTRILIRKVISGVGTDLYQTVTDTIKVAIKWNGTSADVFVNGTKQVSGTSFTTTNMEFLNLNAIPVPYFIQQMALFPTPLSDTDCTTLTT